MSASPLTNHQVYTLLKAARVAIKDRRAVTLPAEAMLAILREVVANRITSGKWKGYQS